ncbi:MAG: hypothetical protein IT165_08250 [Bryobacterales bacterium]|nr:hypothetical protein [Bryobacterales bacterium]
MKPRPPRVFEFLVGLLLPPACREHVLGDLHERYRGPVAYLLEGISAIPRVVVSQVRRTTGWQLLVMEAFTLYLAFLAAAWRFDGAAFPDEGLVIPAAVALITLVLADAYRTAPRRTPQQSLSGVVLAVVVAYATQTVMAAVFPALLVPKAMIAVGLGASLLLLTALRVSLAPAGFAFRNATAEPLTWREIPRRAQKLEGEARRGNFAMAACSLLLLLMGWQAGSNPAPPDRIAGGLIIGAAVFLLYQVYRRRLTAGADMDMAASYRAQLRWRCESLRAIWWWYVAPFFCALLIFALRIPLLHQEDRVPVRNVLPFLVLAVIWSIAMVGKSRLEARRLQREIEALDALPKDPS